MDNIERINKICLENIDYYRNCGARLYAYELIKELEKKVVENEKIINSHLNKDFLKECLSNVDESYYILLYSVIFKEELIDNNILNLLVDNCENKIKPYLDILMMDSVKLENSLIIKIIDQIDKMAVSSKSSINLGYLPFDYRYHILRREEVSFDIKERILKNYDSLNIEDIIDQIYCDLKDEIYNKNIYYISEESLAEYPILKDEKRALEILIKYKKEEKKFYKKMNKI